MKSLTKSLILINLLFVSAVGYAENLQQTMIAIQESQQRALGIQTSPIRAVSTAWDTPYPAKVVVPNAQLRVVSAPLGGLLESLLVAEGETVEKGQTLAVIHSPQVLDQQSSYLEALTDLDLARSEKRRNEALFQEGIIAERRHLESSVRYVQLKTRVEQNRQALILAGMDDAALANLKKNHQLSPSLKVSAPLSGVVLEQLVTPGKQLNALDPIYKVGHLEPLWLEIHVPLDQLGNAAKGSEIRIVEPAITGQVITVGRMVHGADQGVLIRAEISEKVDQLRPGQFVQAQISHASSSKSNSFQIPRSALVRNEGQTWVFVLRPDGFLPLRVDLIREEASTVMVGGALQAGEEIVTAGTAALKAAWVEGTE